MTDFGFKFSSRPEDFSSSPDIARTVIADLKIIYRENALLSMLRFSRGNILIQKARVLTKDMVDKAFES